MAEPRPINPEEQPPKPAAKKMVSDLPQIPGMGQIDQKIDPAVNKAAASKMFKYLSKESYTPADEKKYLAEQLGVKATDKPDIWSLPNGQALRNSDNAAQTSGLNVPYFSTYLLPQPHFTRGGMHDASRFLEQQQQAQGIVDDDGRYLSKAAGKKLSKELATSIDNLFVQQVREVYPQRNEGPPLSRANDQKLAAQLQQGEQYAFLPNHGQAPARAPEHYLSRAAGERVAKELLRGEAEALAVPKPRGQRMGPTLSMAKASRLAQSLQAAEAWSQLPNHGQPLPAPRRHMFSPQQMAEDRELAADLEAGERYAAAKKITASMHKDKKLAKSLQQGLRQVYGNTEKIAEEWGVHQNPTLTLAQDKNVAKYLKSGLDKVFPDPKPKVHHYLSSEGGKKLVKEGLKDEYLEFHHDRIPKPRFLSAAKGPALAAELGASLQYERRAQGPYVHEYYARMRGQEAAHTAPRAFLTQGMSRQEVANKKLAESLQQGLDYYDHMKGLAKAKKGRAGPKMITHEQGRALAAYLLPAKHVGRNEAPALGFAV